VQERQVGKLQNAPVFYVVAQVRHSPVLKIDALAPDLQEKLRKIGFPGYRAINRVNLELSTNPVAPHEPMFQQGVSTSHIFSSRDGTESFIADKDSLAFQTVEYDVFETFSERFERGLTAINEVLAPDSLSRVGLRFLDAVFPQLDQTVGYFIHKQFLGLQDTLDDSWLTEYTFAESAFSRNGQRLISRVLTRNSEVMWPPDLVPAAPPMPDRFAARSGIHALIDTDASFTVDSTKSQEFNVQNILARLAMLKADIRDSFNATVTADALKAWG
jgi:uncharacterized protein (TIGR04255 family)